MEKRNILNAVAGLLVLLILLLFQLFSQIAFPIAMHLWFVPVFTQDAGNVCFVNLIVGDRSPLTKSRQDGCNEPYVNNYGTHRIAAQIY